ncbi:MAG TPA: LysR family transcriptional regulator [Acetobacteraceae bacterium]|nr:LysR family transcriptional regulator [Acetobacteraceae bacterium]
MDRIDAMKVFVAALDEGSLAGAGRKLGRSPAAVSRAIAFLEAHVGTELLHRTTRSIKMSDAGKHYAVACRRVLNDLEEAAVLASSERSAPRGTLALTAPLLSEELVLRPIIDAFIDAYPEVSARLDLTDRPVNLIDAGFDLALRIGNLADSTLVAIRLGEVRRVVVAAPGYLAQHPRIEEPGELSRHQIIAIAQYGQDSWSFLPSSGSVIPRTIQLAPRLVINASREALSFAVNGRGITRALSYQVADMVREGALEIILADHEPPPLPVHLISPHGRLSVPKVRAFVDFAVPRLRSHFAHLAKDVSEQGGIVTITGVGGHGGIAHCQPHKIVPRSPRLPSLPHRDLQLSHMVV